ncbi:unnamed protein product [Prorocentrum cordatum]|uniref:Phospholipase B-like n=1 Tax=Prorocentrum cordatum TaxID=2364126 RepID=A0ABN9WUZ2_9DINO|nr:unnamed protein product [Polarella glacialis]
MGPRNLHGGLAAFAAAHNASWQRELRRHLEFHLRRYDGDASLAPLREAWRANRERNPKTPVWWTPLPSCRSEYGTASEDTDCSADRDLSAELAGGSFVALSVLRVKMSEYVALTAHIEMLDILEGSRSWKTSLMTATGLSEALPDALKKRQQAMFEKMATDSRVPATTPDAPTEPLGPAGVGYSCLVVALMCSVALLLVLRHRPCRTKQSIDLWAQSASATLRPMRLKRGRCLLGTRSPAFTSFAELGCGLKR